MNQSPHVDRIYVRPSRAGPTREVQEAQAIAGQGLEGDHGFPAAQPDQEITLIEAEALEALARDVQIELDPSSTRRNLLTRGVPLNHLVGREFRVGAATLRGLLLCEPCGHLESLTRPGVRKGLIHRGGLRASIVQSGTIRVGDPIDLG